MITLITGAPRSGKSLYTVDKLIQPEIGRMLDIDDDQVGRVIVTRRVLCNINQLMLDHEMIDNEWLSNLHENKKTGDFIVFDEVQRVWPNRPTGSKIPPSVEYLQTHGHDAVDLVILTQSPMLIDPGVRALVGRHLHVRKVGALGGAIVYEWDGCSSSLNFKNAFTKKGYRYSRKAMELYKSARGHTGSRAGLPFVAYLSVIGLVGALVAWPALLGKITGMGKGLDDQVKAPQSAPAPVQLTAERRRIDSLTASPAPSLVDQVGGAGGPLVQAPGLTGDMQPLGTPAPAAPVFAGCAVVRGACTCYDRQGRPHQQEPAACDAITRPAVLSAALPDAPQLLRPAPSLDDQDLARFVAERQGRLIAAY